VVRLLQDDDHLTFSIAAAEEWIADFFVDAASCYHATTGIKLSFTTPAGATLNAIATLQELQAHQAPLEAPEGGLPLLEAHFLRMPPVLAV